MTCNICGKNIIDGEDSSNGEFRDIYQGICQKCGNDEYTQFFIPRIINFRKTLNDEDKAIFDKWKFAKKRKFIELQIKAGKMI